MSAQLQPAQASEAGGYQVGPGRPPLHSRWRKGTSGNPLGRPRRVGYGRQGMPFIPDLARALARQVETAFQGEGHQLVSLPEFLVNELTHMVATRHDLGAARTLGDWFIQTECARAELEAEAAAEAEEAAARAEAEERATRESAEAERRAREERAQRAAQERLRELAEATHADGCDGDCEGLCFDEWTDTLLIDRALIRLGAAAMNDEGMVRLEPWVIEAAMARTPETALNAEERATLALVTIGGGDEGAVGAAPDWVARLENVGTEAGNLVIDAR